MRVRRPWNPGFADAPHGVSVNQITHGTRASTRLFSTRPLEPSQPKTQLRMPSRLQLCSMRSSYRKAKVDDDWSIILLHFLHLNLTQLESSFNNTQWNRGLIQIHAIIKNHAPCVVLRPDIRSSTTNTFLHGRPFRYFSSRFWLCRSFILLVQFI